MQTKLLWNKTNILMRGGRKVKPTISFQTQTIQRRQHWQGNREAALQEQLVMAFKLSPQSSPEELLQQLELHERLDKLHECRQLKKCIFSAYLRVKSYYHTLEVRQHQQQIPMQITTLHQRYAHKLQRFHLEQRDLQIKDLKRLAISFLFPLQSERHGF